MRQQMLPQQIFSVVVPIRRPHDDVDVVADRLLRIFLQMPRISRPLVVKFDQHHWTVYPVIIYAVISRAADPRETRLLKVRPHLNQLHLRVPAVHIINK
jgi:hypothetical protein